MKTSGDAHRRMIEDCRIARAKLVDDGMLWVRPVKVSASQQQNQWWPGLEQKIRDFHAQYERACFED